MRPFREVFESQEKRMDARFALLCSVFANCHRDPKTKRQPYTVDDFMPRERPQTREALLLKLKAFAGSMR